MSDSENSAASSTSEGAQSIPKKTELVKQASSIIHDSRVPLALFLEDCLASVDPRYMSSIVRVFISSRYKLDESEKLYKGLSSPTDERGRERDTLTNSDVLFLLHLFDFCVAGKAIQDQAKDWHPKLLYKLPFERDTVTHQIESVRKVRNRVEHKTHTIKTIQDVEFIRGDVLKLFLENVFVVIEMEPQLFRNETVSEVTSLIESLRKPVDRKPIQAPGQSEENRASPEPEPATVTMPANEGQPSRMVINAAIGLAILVASFFAFTTRTKPVTEMKPTSTLVIIATEKLNAEARRKFVSMIRDSYHKDTVIRVAVVWGDDRVCEQMVNITSDRYLNQLLDTLQFEAMTDITQFTPAFHDGYQLMRRYKSDQLPLNMVILGRLPETTRERHAELVKQNWSPVEKEDLAGKWEESKLGRIRWYRSGTKRSDERDFVDHVLCSKGDTLRPIEVDLR